MTTTQSIELLDPEPALVTVEARAAVALKSTETELQLRELAAKNKAIVAIIDKPGREQAHGAAMELKRTRTAIQAVSKTAREDATKFSKAVIAEEARLIAIIEPEETRLLALRDGWDTEQARIKAEREAAERQRVMDINERIVHIRGYVSLALECRTAERVAGLIAKLRELVIGEGDYQEFLPEALTVRDAAITRMTEIHDSRLADEVARAKAKAEQEAAAEALRLEREAFAAAQAEAKRVADEAAAKQKAEADALAAALAAQRAAFEAEMETNRQAIAAEARRIADERAALEAAKAPAVSESYTPLPVIDCAVTAIETVALSEGLADLLDSEPLVLSGQPLSIAIEPKSPPVEALIQAVADTFSVSMETAADWLTSAADDIANFQ
jgi:hypothetical protein